MPRGSHSRRALWRAATTLATAIPTPSPKGARTARRRWREPEDEDTTTASVGSRSNRTEDEHVSCQERQARADQAPGPRRSLDCGRRRGAPASHPARSRAGLGGCARRSPAPRGRPGQRISAPGTASSDVQGPRHIARRGGAVVSASARLSRTGTGRGAIDRSGAELPARVEDLDSAMPSWTLVELDRTATGGPACAPGPRRCPVRRRSRGVDGARYGRRWRIGITCDCHGGGWRARAGTGVQRLEDLFARAHERDTADLEDGRGVRGRATRLTRSPIPACSVAASVGRARPARARGIHGPETHEGVEAAWL